MASILASAWNEHVLDKKHLPLQDTNDRFLANIQRDGTYSVVPRVPGGEITPDQLIALGTVAKRYGLYTKITGAQRVDLFGARVEQLPAHLARADRRRLRVGPRLRQGAAHGEVVRRRDLVPLRRAGLGRRWPSRSRTATRGCARPHKLKSAVSGCARECAEAQGKDFGIIATEKGYNLYLCGNGGMKPQHAQLFATDLDEATLIRYLDRFLMFYIRTADRLQRTAIWLNNLEGGIDYLRQVIIDDSLGIAPSSRPRWPHVVGSYRCEWKATLEDPAKLKQFRPFVNVDAADPSIVFIRQRGQHRPAEWDEKRERLKEAG